MFNISLKENWWKAANHFQMRVRYESLSPGKQNNGLFWKPLCVHKRDVLTLSLDFVHFAKLSKTNYHINVEGLVVKRVDNAIHRIKHYPTDSIVSFINTYPLSG